MNDLCTRLIFGRVQRSFFWGDVIAIVRYVYVLCMRVPRPRAPPSEKGGVCRRDYIMYKQRTCWIFINHSMRICMTINKHAACALCSGEVPVTLYSVSIQAERNAVDESWVYFSCILLIAAQMKSRNPLWNPEIRLKPRYPSRNPLWNPEIRFEIQKFAWNPEIPREIHFEIQKSALKSRNPLWNPEIHFEIQKSTLKSRNPFWNPKSILKSEIHLKSSGFRNLVRRDAPWRTPR